MSNVSRPIIHALVLALILAMPTIVLATESTSSKEENEIKVVLARFYEGWNAHDVDKMISVYAEDVDHINTYARWNRGKPAIREDLRNFHAGPGRSSRKTYSVEKIRFIKPDVALVQVRSLSSVGNIGTYVVTKESGEWLVVSFTNVEYALVQSEPSR
jgi:uncharacterized protein (TIGR02246 family)